MSRRLTLGRMAGLVGLIATGLVPGPTPVPGLAQTPPPERAVATAAEQVVMRQVDAYNRHDLEAFLATYAPDVRWYAFPDSLMGSGIEGLRAIFTRLFAEQPTFKAEVRRKIVRGNYVILEEHGTGFSSGVPIDDVAIYEVKGDKITKVWFFP